MSNSPYPRVSGAYTLTPAVLHLKDLVTNFEAAEILRQADEVSRYARPVTSPAREDRGSVDMGDGVRRGLNYGVVTGFSLQIAAPALWAFALGPLMRYMQTLCAGKLVWTGGDESLNINVVQPGVGGYEWHFDSTPMTAVLFLTNMPSDEGALLWRDPETDQVQRVTSVRGVIVAGDLSQVAHAVEPFNMLVRRSAPISYQIEGTDTTRADDYIYRGDTQ